MANYLKLTPSRLKEMRAYGEQSLYYFARGLLGNDWLDFDLHDDLCAMLEGRPPYFEWQFGLVCGFRGSLKSTVVLAEVLRRLLYRVNYEVLWVEQKEENAILHHEKLQQELRIGKNAGLLQEMFSDRIPAGFEGWNKHQTVMVRTIPQAGPSMQVAGLESKMEGKHPHMIVVDDPEGADADKSDVSNDDAQRFIFERAEPLMKDKQTSQLLVVGTPHGKRPTVHHIRRSEANGSTAPADRKDWCLWWKPIADADGKPAWPEKFPRSYIDKLERMAKQSPRMKRMVRTQYFLEEHGDESLGFDMDVIRRGQFEMDAGRALRYPAPRMESAPGLEGLIVPGVLDRRSVNIAYTRRFIHVDPAHRDPENRVGSGKERPSDWAILVTAVAPDHHVFLLEEWISEATFDAAVRNLFFLYRKWRPYQVSYEPIGAQAWLQHMIPMLERTEYRKLMSLPSRWAGPPGRLPSLSSRMVAVEKKNAQKAPWIVEQLEGAYSMGLLHVNEALTPITVSQHEMVSDTLAKIDGPDALAQGPEVWSAPPSPGATRIRRFKAHLERLMRPAHDLTGYRRPWETTPNARSRSFFSQR